VLSAEFSDVQANQSNWYSDASQFYFDTGGASGVQQPIILDLTGNGISITQQTSSNTFFDMTGSGQQNLTAWAGAGNGVLFFDPAGNGQLTQANQIVFTDWDPSATSDMQALLDVFDTNHDGSLDAGDAAFANFFVMETNADGTQTAHSLASLGITSIALNADATNIALPDGSSIDGETTYTTANGTTGKAATVTFATDPNGYAVTTTTTTNADGSVTIANIARNADGSVAYQRVLDTLVATKAGTGVTTTTRTLAQLDSGGVVSSLQTDDTVAGNGTTTETLVNYADGAITASGELTSAGVTGLEKLNSTTTTTTVSGGETKVTIDRDQTGGGTTTQEEVDTTHADGSTCNVVSDLNPDASVSDRKKTEVSVDGLTRTVTDEVDGNSALATSSTDVTTVSGSTRTETVTHAAGTTVTSLVQTTIQTTADKVARTITSDLTDGSTLDLTTEADTTTNADGSSTTTQTDKSADGTLLDKTLTTVTPQSGGGLATTVVSSVLDGSGALVEADSKTTTISNAGAAQTTTVEDDSANGTLLSKSTTTSTLGSAARTVTTYANGDGAVTQSEVVAVAGATTTDTLENLNADGTLVSATVTTTTNGGLTTTTQVDSTGGGTAAAPVFDHTTTDVVTSSASGSTETVSDYGASTANPIDRTQTVVSANGLHTTVSTAFTSASLDNPGTWDQVSDDLTTVNADGSLSETTTVTDGAGHVLQTTQKSTSADRRTVTTTATQGTTNLATTVETVSTLSSGAVQDTSIAFDQHGDVTGATVTTTSADGLTKTVQKDIQGQSAAAYAANGLVFDRTTTDTTVIYANGSRSESIIVTSRNGTALSVSSVTTSANGLVTDTIVNPYAAPHFASQTTDRTTLNADGSKTETVADYSYNNTLVDQTSTTTSANGLSTTALRDLDGDGIIDRSSTDLTMINADGSRTEVLTDHTGGTNGTVRDVTTTHSGIIVAGAGLETVVTRQSNGSVPSYQVETILPSANGTVVDTTQTYAAAGGALLLTTTVTTSANGTTKTTATAVNGDTTVDFFTFDATVPNVDGSKTETVANYNRAGLISETVTTTSANGLMKTTSVDANGATNGAGAAIFDLATTDNTVLNTADGSRTETGTQINANGTTIAKTTTTTSADQQTITTNRYLDETGTIGTLDQSEVVQTQADGSKTDTTTSYDASHALLGTVVKTTSGNGLATSTTYKNASGATVDAQSCNVSYDTNGDGGTLTDCEDADVVNGTTTLTSSVRTQTSGNQQNKTITMLLSGALASANASSFSVVAQDTVGIADTGVKTETITDTIGSATSANDTTTIVTAADGLATTTSTKLAGGASPYIVDTKTTNLDGSQNDTTTYYDPAALSVIETQRTVATSWDGNTVATTTQSDFDGTHYNVVHDTVVKNADGTTTETRSGTGSFGAPAFSQTITTVTNADESRTTTTLNYDGSGKLIEQTVAGVSANGLVKSFVYDTTGQDSLATLKTAAADLLAGAALPSTMLSGDIIALDTTTLNADGSKTEVVETAAGNSFATLRTLTTSTTSADGLTTVTKVDNDGNGVFEQVDTRTAAPDGSTTDVVDYYGDTAATASTLTGSNTTTTSANGLISTLTTSSGITDTTVTLADANGSYQFAQTVVASSTAATQGYAAGSASHDIDANGIDTWSWQDGATGGSSGTITVDVATESQDVAIANQIYMTLLGRGMDQAETQYLAHYISNGVLDRQGLAQAIVTDAKGEYANDFYDVLNYELGSVTNTSTLPVAVMAAFENSFGRMPSAEEMSSFGAITGPGNTTASNIAAMGVAIAQYAADQGSTNLHTLIDPNKGLTQTAPSWINPASAPDQNFAAAVFGSSLGQALSGGNTFAHLAQNTAINVVESTLAPIFKSLFGIGSNAASAVNAADNALASISPSLASAFAAQPLSLLTSFLSGELAQGLGLNGTSFGAQLLRAVSGSLLSTALNNVASAVGITTGISGDPFYGIPSFLGGYLAHDLVQPENQGGAIGGQLLGGLGSALLGSATTEILTSLGLNAAIDTGADLILDTVLAFALPGVGAFIGTIIGTLLGNLFGSLFSDTETQQLPNAGVGITLSAGAHQFVEGAVNGYGSADINVAQNVETTVFDILNQFIGAIGGTISNSDGLGIGFGVGTNTNGVNYAYGGVSVMDRTVRDSTTGRPLSYGRWSEPTVTNQMIANMVITALKALQFTGGNAYMVQALANSKATTLEQLAGDLKIGEDYGRYLANKSIIDDLIALNPDSTFAAGWLVTLLQAQALGLTNNTVVFGVGYSSEIINNLHTSTKTDSVMFGPGIAASALSFTQSGNDLLISVSGQSATLTIQNWFLGPSYQIGSFVLANGTALTPTITVQGSATNNTLMAGPYETLLGGTENDTYVFDRGAGSIVIYDNGMKPTTITAELFFNSWTVSESLVASEEASYESRYGVNQFRVTARTPTYSYTPSNYTYQPPIKTLTGYQDTINGYKLGPETVLVQTSNGSNTLQFGPGIAVTDIEVQASGNDLLIGVKDPSNPNATFAQLTDQIRIQNWVNPLNQVQAFQFADGTTLGVAEITALENGKIIAPPSLSVQSASGNAGSAIALSIASAITSTDGTETLSINIAGLPSGAALSAGTHNSDGSWTLTPAQLANLSLTAPAGSFAGTANLTVTATATEPDGSHLATTTTLPVSVAGVASAPALSVAAASGNAGSTIALTIASALTATDGSETLAIKIAGVPSGMTLSAGTQNADSSWTLTPAQLANLALITPPAGSYAGTANLTVTATATEQDGSQASATATLPVSIAGVATAPTLAVQSASGSAGAAIPLLIASALTATDGTETLAITITGVPATTALSAGTRNANGTWTLTPAQLSNLTLSVPAGAFAGTANLTVTATATETDGSQAACSAALPVAITGVASAPALTVSNTSGNSGAAIPLSIASALTATDGTETLAVKVTGVPSNATLSAGTANPDGSWSLTAAQLANLSMTLPAGSFAGTVPLTVTATATETDGSQATSSAGLSVAIAGVATAPTLAVSGASGTAGSVIALSIASALTATDGLETLSIKITNVPGSATLSAGTKNADGSWSLTPAQLANLTLTTPVGSFAGTANLTVTATATETDGSQASSSAALPVVIAGVATTPTLSVQSASGSAGSIIPLSIASALTATDGAETLAITIAGLPAGATLSAGTQNADGSWTLTGAQLGNLNLIAPPSGAFAGTASLTVTATAAETDGSQASASAPLALTIAGVASPPTLSVQSAAGNAGSAIALSIASALTATDGTETLSINIAALPSGASLSAGTHNADGSWTLTPAQLANLTFTTPAGSFAGTANLAVTVTATENNGSHVGTSATLAVVVAGVASAPTLNVSAASGNAGSSIPLSIASALTATDGAETLAIKITGVPSGASLSAGAHNGDGSWTLTPSQLSGLHLTAPAAGSFAGTANLTVTATATETDGSQASTTASLPVAIAGVASAPTLTVSNASGNAGAAIPLAIASALTATDGTETLAIKITGVPSMATLSAGTRNGDGSWSLTPAQLSNLTLSVAAGAYAGPANLTITATATETDASQASTSAPLAVSIAGVATTPTLTVANAAGNAGAAIPLSITSALTATDGTETLSVKITNVPSSATLSAGTKNADGSWTLTPAQLANLTFTVPAGSFAGTANLTVTATATETDGSQATRTATLPVAVTGIATAPTLSLAITGANSGAIPLAITAVNTPGGGTQTLSYTVTGLPSTASLSAGTKNANGSWSLTAAQISGLSMTLPAGSFTGSANLTVTATATAVDGSQASTSGQLLVADNGNRSLTAGNGIAVVLGGSGVDTLTAGSGTDMLNPGGAGADTMVGGAGNDTFVYGSGYGSDIINNLHTAAKTDTVMFGPGIAASALSFVQNGNDLVIHVAGQSGTLTIQNWFLGPSYQIGSFVLANGTAVTPTITVQGSASNNTLMAGPYETMLGGAENDTYVFGRGAGSVVIYDNATTTTEQLVWQNVVVAEPATVSAVNARYGLHLNYIQVIQRSPTYSYGTDGYGNPTRTFAGYEDSINGFQAHTVQSSNGANTISFGSGIAVSDIEVEASGNDLIIGVKNPSNPNATFAQLTDKIRIQNWINPLNQVQTFKFADGTTLTASSILSLASSNGTETLSSTGAIRNLIGSNADAIVLNGAGNTGTISSTSSGDTLTVSGTGNTLIGGTGTDSLTTSSNGNTLIAGTGATTMTDSGTQGIYQYGTGNGVAHIVNGAASNGSASNQLQFGSGNSDEQLWFIRSGNNLQIDLMGSQSQVTVNGWFAATGNQLQAITAVGLQIDSQVSQLVQAMATYSTNNPSFNPTTASQVPNDANLQGAIAAAWHH
jgi:YD repeat-containing protein